MIDNRAPVMKLVERELGSHRVSCDIECHLFSILPPFNIGAATMRYGPGWAAAFITRARVEALTASTLFSTRETVATETRAFLATSSRLMVRICRRPRHPAITSPILA